VFFPTSDADVTMSGSTFHENQAEDGGGAVFLDKSRLNVQQSMFVRNHAGKMGGALVIARQSQGSLTHSNFHLCASKDGGAVALVEDAHLMADSNDYSSNVATGNGGGEFQTGVLQHVSRITLETENLFDPCSTVRSGLACW
jgi:hypothetical protein